MAISLSIVPRISCKLQICIVFSFSYVRRLPWKINRREKIVHVTVDIIMHHFEIRDTESFFARRCCIMIRRLNISGISTQDDFHPHAPLSSLMDIIRAELFNQRNFNLFAVNFSLTLLLSWPLSPVPSITSYLSFLQFVCAFLLPHFTFVSYYYTSVKRQMTKHKRLNGNPK